jgi:hypothetical protein
MIDAINSFLKIIYPTGFKEHFKILFNLLIPIVNSVNFGLKKTQVENKDLFFETMTRS